MCTETEIRAISAAASGGDEDDPPVLSSRTLEALREFLSEQGASIGEAARGEGSEEEVRLVAEDWRLSQFWYDRETAETVTEEIRTLCQYVSAPAIACISCPTIYVYLKKLNPDIPLRLLEYDKRFEQYGNDYTFYDYNQPEDLPQELKHGYSVIVADPPYLSKECLEKVTQTISFLSQPEHAYLLLLTGAVQEERAVEMLNVHPCNFRPQHTNKLGNEFMLFTNYDPLGRLGGWEQNN